MFIEFHNFVVITMSGLCIFLGMCGYGMKRLIVWDIHSCSALSSERLRTLAEFGCPSTDRKVVNAGKRLRVSLNIAEGSVS